MAWMWRGSTVWVFSPGRRAGELAVCWWAAYQPHCRCTYVVGQYVRQLVWRQHGLDERDLCDITHRESLVRCGGDRVVEMKTSTGRKRSKGRIVVEGKKNGQPKAPRPGIQASQHPSSARAACVVLASVTGLRVKHVLMFFVCTVCL